MGLALELARAARDAAPEIAAAPAEVRSSAIRTAAALLRENAGAVVSANVRDMARAKESGMSEGLLDRLMLDEARIGSIADAMDEVASQPDPLGKVVGGHVNANGLRIQKVTVPLGVVAMIYEARPNVTADAFALCLRAGNACVLKGGSAANETCMAIAGLCRRACDACGLPADAVSYVEDDAEHTQTAELLGAVGLIDVLIPRGGAGGMTISLPEEDRLYQSKRELQERICTCLGGRVAEELILGDISTGASSDIQRATAIARKMVGTYGMSEKLGNVAFDAGTDEVFIGKSMGHTRPYSEQTAAAMDTEIRAIIDTAYDRCRTILAESKPQLEAVAAYLLEHETMDAEVFESYFPPKTPEE